MWKVASVIKRQEKRLLIPARGTLVEACTARQAHGGAARRCAWRTRRPPSVQVVQGCCAGVTKPGCWRRSDAKASLLPRRHPPLAFGALYRCYGLRVAA
eukprot:3904215-Pleurochrysis_carterae.AAC.3